MSETDIVHVPHKASGEARNAVIGGHVQMMFDAITTMAPNVAAGQVRALGTTGTKRSELTPDVPTIAEAGVPGFEVDGWYGLLAPKATPPPVIRRFNAELAALLATDEMKERLLAAGIDASASSPAEFHDRIARDITRWSEVVKKARIAAE
jgi:tripartite-type tricarboxylate transporter receptor subunit TctC